MIASALRLPLLSRERDRGDLPATGRGVLQAFPSNIPLRARVFFRNDGFDLRRRRLTRAINQSQQKSQLERHHRSSTLFPRSHTAHSGFGMRDILPVRVSVGTFQLDLKAGELYKSGRKIRLQEQPFQILLMLIDHAGEVVSREDIQSKLWPNDTVVEFDHGINTAIKKLRTALNDSAEKPNYIETVARRGYRLMVPVEWPSVSSDTD